jgi:hypothetical protein
VPFDLCGERDYTLKTSKLRLLLALFLGNMVFVGYETIMIFVDPNNFPIPEFDTLALGGFVVPDPEIVISEGSSVFDNFYDKMFDALNSLAISSVLLVVLIGIPWAFMHRAGYKTAGPIAIVSVLWSVIFLIVFGDFVNKFTWYIGIGVYDDFLAVYWLLPLSWFVVLIIKM